MLPGIATAQTVAAIPQPPPGLDPDPDPAPYVDPYAGKPVPGRPDFKIPEPPKGPTETPPGWTRKGDPNEPLPVHNEKDSLQPDMPGMVVDEDLKAGRGKSDDTKPTGPKAWDLSALKPTEALVMLTLSDAQVFPGDVIQARLTIGVNGAAGDLEATLVLPEGLEPRGSEQRDFDPATRSIQVRNLKADDGGFAETPLVLAVSRTARSATNPFTVQVRAGGQALTLVSEVLPVLMVSEEVAKKNIGTDGGEMSLSGSRVKLNFPPGWLKNNRAFDAAVFRGQGGGLSFKVLPDTKFDTPVTAVIELAGLLPEGAMEPQLMRQVIREVDVEQTDARGTKRVIKQTRVELEPVLGSTWNKETQRLEATLESFSTHSVIFSVPGGKPEPWKLRPSSGSVSQFSGSASFSYPIDVPKFPGAGAPGLSIRYSSSGGEDAYEITQGWGLDGVPMIQRGVKLLKWQYQQPLGVFFQYFTLETDEFYRISVGGADYNLVYKSSANGADEYVPESYSPIRVYRCAFGTSCNGTNLPWLGTFTDWAGNTSPHYWQAWLPDGTRYVFGTDASSTVLHRRRENNVWAYQAWYAKFVFDPVRDDPNTNGAWSAQYFYTEQANQPDNGMENGQASWIKGADWDKRTRLTQVRYGNRHSSNKEIYRVELAFNNSWSGINDRLRSFTTYANNVPVKHVVIHPMAGTPRIGGIQTYGLNSASQWAQLPATTFLYRDNNASPLLERINNGYGGSEIYKYSQMSRQPPTGASVTWFQVYERELNDGNGVATTEHYSYVGPCYNDVGSACHFGRDTLYPDSRGNLMGYAQSWKEVRPTGTGVASNLSAQRTEFHTDKQRLGQMAATRSFNADKTQVLSAQQRTVVSQAGGAFGQPAAAWRSYVEHDDVFPYTDINYNANPVVYKRTTYAYDNLGNVISEYQNGFMAVTGDERSTHRGYLHNMVGAAWVVGKLQFENKFDGIVANNGNLPETRSQTHLFYDGLGFGVAPSKGLVTRVERRLTPNWVYELYEYNSSGMPTKITDALGRITTAAYDLVSLQVTDVWNALNHQTSYCYFGITTARCGGVGHLTGYQWGMYHYTIDPNWVMVNRVWYDWWGRTTSVIQPGDSDSQWTQLYTYSDANQYSVTNFKVETWQRESGSLTHPTFTFHDGFGRAIQTRSEVTDGASQRVVDTTYDALGRQQRQYVPVEQSFQWGFSRPGGWNTNRPSTLTEYDLLGRVSKFTGADGHMSQHFYAHDWNRPAVPSNLWTGYALHTVQDARLNAKMTATDGLGRTRRVRDYAAPAGAANLLAETRYEYGWLDQLTQVIMPDGAQTTMTYDHLMRKTSMNDVSMGYWSYGYDSNGNMVSQTDARGVTLTFEYDWLNRQVAKRRNGATLVYNYWDNTWDTLNPANRLGRLIESAVWNEDTNAWEVTRRNHYDARGRTISHDIWVAGIGYWNTSKSYDSADRVTATTYPDGELVNSSYKPSMEPNTLSGSSNYISGSSYNALGQVGQLTYGNGLVETNDYYGLNGIANGQNGASPMWFSVHNAYGRLFRRTLAQGANTRLVQQWAYDQVGNVLDQFLWSPNRTWESSQFSYDAMDRLTNVGFRAGHIQAEGTSIAYNAAGNITSMTGVGSYDYVNFYSCTNAATKHSIKSTTVNNSAVTGYCYDNNGNNTWRAENGKLYLQYWSVDNRLKQSDQFALDYVTNLGTRARYWYDAEGALVRRESNGQTVVHVGPHFERNITTGVNTKYYYFGGRRVAMRQGITLTYLHGDHLGSASMQTDTAGGIVAEQRYAAYGKERWNWGTLGTDRRYTGQRTETSTGLYDYNARQYSPTIGRFISPDSIVPDPNRSQDLNRYMYVRGNPVGYTDPSGHAPVSPWKCPENPICEPTLREIFDPRNIQVAPEDRPKPLDVDVTKWTFDRVGEIISDPDIAYIRARTRSGIPNGYGIKRWVRNMRGGARWDFKVDLRSYTKFIPGTENVVFGGRSVSFQAVANFTFGIAGASAGIAQWFNLAGAGFFQTRENDPSQWGTIWTYFDDPHDAWWIKFGYETYYQFGASVTDLSPEAFGQWLEEYIHRVGGPPLPLNEIQDAHDRR
jgi:RHS repeat-associated protein